MLRQVRMAVMAAVVITGACKKDEGQPVPSAKQGELVPRPAAIDRSKLSAPALFDHVPADTPYMIGSFESLPIDRLTRMYDEMAPMWGAFEASLQDGADRVQTRLVAAIAEELGGHWSAEALEKVGFDPRARFVVYGLGLQAIVFRYEIADPERMIAAIESVARRAELSLPARETHDGRELWRIVKDDKAVVLSFADKQAVFAMGDAEKLQSSLGLIVGTEKPRASMAGGKVLADIAVENGFGPHAIGFVDGARVIEHAFQLPEVDLGPGCKPALERLVQQAPRALVGYSPLDGDVWSASLVIELAPERIAELKALKVDIPGLSEVLAGRPLFAMGMGADLERGRQLLRSAATNLHLVMDACGSREVADDLARVADTLASPLPPLVTHITGVALAIDQLSFAPGLVPDKVEAVAFVTASDSRSLYSEIEKLAPVSQLGVRPDGKLHPLSGLPLPIALRAAVGSHALVVAAGGDRSTKLAEKVLAARPSGKAPLVIASYDYPRLIELQRQIEAPLEDMKPADPANADAQRTAQRTAQHELEAAVAKLFGHAEFAIDITDHGLVFWASLEMK